MTSNELRDSRYAKADEMYSAVMEKYGPDELASALIWAKNTLTEREGSGHIFDIVGHEGGYQPMVCCSFAKPEWGGDHCSRPMSTGSEAVVMAVCEYLCGC